MDQQQHENENINVVTNSCLSTSCLLIFFSFFSFSFWSFIKHNNTISSSSNYIFDCIYYYESRWHLSIGKSRSEIANLDSLSSATNTITITHQPDYFNRNSFIQFNFVSNKFNFISFLINSILHWNFNIEISYCKQMNFQLSILSMAFSIYYLH